MQFASPWMFLLLLTLPVAVWWSRRGRRAGAIRFSTTAGAAKAGRSLRQRLSFAPMALRIAALVLLTVALARPQKGMERVRDINKGIAIEMIVDRSGSMRDDNKWNQAVSAIVEAAKTGQTGDGKVFVTPISEAVRIRTGDRDSTAL